MDTKELIDSKKEEVLRLARYHGAKNVRVFGSVARKEAGPLSDVDLLVEMEAGRSLLDLIALEQELETLLNRKVDLLTDNSISPYLEDRIYSEAVPL